MNNSIENDKNLLTLMLRDLANLPEIYQPSPYWQTYTNASVREIAKFGLNDFRGCTNGIGNSYADNALVDIRGSYNQGIRKALSHFMRIKPFSLIFNAQVKITKHWFESSVEYKNVLANSSVRVAELMGLF